MMVAKRVRQVCCHAAQATFRSHPDLAVRLRQGDDLYKNGAVGTAEVGFGARFEGF